jgi:hypothetical protein
MSKLCATLDLSRGLRVDERNNLKFPLDSGKPIDSGKESTVVYCGGAARVSEGFAIALQPMGMMHVDTGSESDDSQSGG